MSLLKSVSSGTRLVRIVLHSSTVSSVSTLRLSSFSTSSIMSGELVLVSGASGYLGSWVCKRLQEHGYRVRGTVRSLQNKEKVEFLYKLCAEPQFPMELVEADLMNADSWTEAVKDCKYVMHTASPFIFGTVKDPEKELITPAVQGTLNVLRAASEAGVEKVVLTSSYAAVVESGRKEGAFGENDWSIPEKQNNHYMRSKTIAEKAAWDFVKELPHGKKFALSTILPVGIRGPPLSTNGSESTNGMIGLFNGAIPRVPKLHLNAVDVRDVAEAHVRCLTNPDAAGKRVLLDAGVEYMPDTVRGLDEEFGPQGYKLPKGEVPTTLIKVASWFSSQAKDARTLGEHPKEMDTSILRNTLGITPIEPLKSAVEMIYSLIENGSIKKTEKYRGPPSSL